MGESNTPMEETSPDQRKELEIAKLKLETEKLGAELKHLNRHLLKNPQFLAPIVSIIAVLVTVGYTFYSGLWDVKMEKLANTKLVLQIDIDRFQKEKDTLSRQVSEIRSQKILLEKQNQKLKSQINLINKKYKDIFGKYNSQKEELAQELLEVDNLLNQGKSREAFEKLRALIIKLKKWENRDFDPFDFSEEDFG